MPEPVSKPSRNLGPIILGGLALLLVGGIVAYALFPSAPPPLDPVVAAVVPQATPVSVLPAPVSMVTPAPAVAAHTPAPDLKAEAIPAWEGTIDNVLNSNVDEAQMAQILINLLPTLPEDGQIEAANHISNLLPDENYKAVKPLLMNPNLPESVQSVFFTDLMNRDEDTKLNAFLDIAQMPNHPFHDEALSDLQIYVGDDYGEDWGKWKSAVNQYLKAASSDSDSQ